MFGLFGGGEDGPIEAELQPLMPNNKTKHTKAGKMVVQRKHSANSLQVKPKILDWKFRIIQTDSMMFLHMNSCVSQLEWALTDKARHWRAKAR
jgi:hypothetical protein